MKRLLVIRLLSLVLAPIVSALVFGYFFQRYFLWAIAAAGCAILTNFALSVRDGAVLERGGTVCVRERDGTWFWIWIALHSSWGLLMLGGTAPFLLE